MSDFFEKKLKDAVSAKPKRRLSSQFTHNVLEAIDKEAYRNKKGVTFMRLFQKPVGVALSILFAMTTGVAAYAAVANWPTVVSVFSGERLLESGARVVKIESDGCKTGENGNGENKRSVGYYEIRKDSKLSNKEALSMIQGICEEDVVNNRVGKFMPTVQGTYSTRIMTIQDKSATLLTVTLDNKYDSSMSIYSGAVSFPNISPTLQVRDGDTVIGFSDLKKGDSIVLILRDERDISVEDKDYKVDQSQVQVRGILKVPALTGSPDLFYANLGKEFVRVEPSASGKGFTRAYEFDK